MREGHPEKQVMTGPSIEIREQPTRGVMSLGPRDIQMSELATILSEPKCEWQCPFHAIGTIGKRMYSCDDETHDSCPVIDGCSRCLRTRLIVIQPCARGGRGYSNRNSKTRRAPCLWTEED